MFGGEAGVALDVCYHSACDNMTNLNTEAFELHAKAIAESVATYAASWEGFPARTTTTALARRSASVKPHVRRSNEAKHYRKPEPVLLRK